MEEIRHALVISGAKRQSTNYGLSFSGFKTKKTLRRLNLKLKNNNIATRNIFRRSQARSLCE